MVSLVSPEFPIRVFHFQILDGVFNTGLIHIEGLRGFYFVGSRPIFIGTLFDNRSACKTH